MVPLICIYDAIRLWRLLNSVIIKQYDESICDTKGHNILCILKPKEGLKVSHHNHKTFSILSFIYFLRRRLYRARFGSTYTKIGTIQRRLAWPLRKDDTQIREAFHIFVDECTVCTARTLMRTLFA